jgi:hypothetical protein
MPADKSIEQRLLALETALAEIQRRLGIPPTDNWIDRFTGSFKDDPVFAEMVELGRAIREAERPPEEPTVSP